MRGAALPGLPYPGEPDGVSPGVREDLWRIRFLVDAHEMRGLRTARALLAAAPCAAVLVLASCGLATALGLLGAVRSFAPEASESSWGRFLVSVGCIAVLAVFLGLAAEAGMWLDRAAEAARVMLTRARMPAWPERMAAVLKAVGRPPLPPELADLPGWLRMRSAAEWRDAPLEEQAAMAGYCAALEKWAANLVDLEQQIGTEQEAAGMATL